MYSPDFIYDISVARCAREFLSGELTLETFAGKYTQGLTELYSEVELQEIQHILEESSDLVRGGRWPALSKSVT